MALSDIDRSLLERCLAHEPQSWEELVDRFLGLVVHVVNHTAQARSIRLSDEDREDLCSEVFLEILKSNFAVLRAFRCESSLATYLTVIARRVVVRSLTRRKSTNVPLGAEHVATDNSHSPEQRISDRDEVQRLLQGLGEHEAEVVRMYHLEGRTYSEISTAVGVPENSVGPTLSRARAKLRDRARS